MLIAWALPRVSGDWMPVPHNERRALEQERAELQARIAGWNIEFGTTDESAIGRREFLDWQIRNARRRLLVIADRLEALDKDPAT